MGLPGEKWQLFVCLCKKYSGGGEDCQEVYIVLLYAVRAFISIAIDMMQAIREHHSDENEHITSWLQGRFRLCGL